MAWYGMLGGWDGRAHVNLVGWFDRLIVGSIGPPTSQAVSQGTSTQRRTDTDTDTKRTHAHTSKGQTQTQRDRHRRTHGRTHQERTDTERQAQTDGRTHAPAKDRHRHRDRDRHRRTDARTPSSDSSPDAWNAFQVWDVRMTLKVSKMAAASSTVTVLGGWVLGAWKGEGIGLCECHRPGCFGHKGGWGGGKELGGVSVHRHRPGWVFEGVVRTRERENERARAHMWYCKNMHTTTTNISGGAVGGMPVLRRPSFCLLCSAV